MKDIFGILLSWGSLLFIAFGVAAANSIYARKYKKVENIMVGLSFVGLALLIIGGVGLIIVNL